MKYSKAQLGAHKWIRFLFSAQSGHPQYELLEIRESKYKLYEKFMRTVAWVILARVFLGIVIAIGTYVSGTKVIMEYATFCLTIIAHVYMPLGWWVLLRRTTEIAAWMERCAYEDGLTLPLRPLSHGSSRSEGEKNKEQEEEEEAEGKEEQEEELDEEDKTEMEHRVSHIYDAH